MPAAMKAHAPGKARKCCRKPADAFRPRFGKGTSVLFPAPARLAMLRIGFLFRRCNPMRDTSFTVAASRDPLVGPESGSALVEFTLILPILVLLLLGVADFGLALQQAMVAADAAHAGALWATQAGLNATNANLQNAAAAVGGSQVTVDTANTNFVYACSITAAKTTSQPTCSSGSLMTWAQVNTYIRVPALFGYPGLPTSFTLSGSSMIRVR